MSEKDDMRLTLADQTSAPSMVERMARALFDKEHRRKGGWTFDDEAKDPALKAYWLTSARAAISAMRATPVDAICARVVAAHPVMQGGHQLMKDIWQAMIDAALSEDGAKP